MPDKDIQLDPAHFNIRDLLIRFTIIEIITTNIIWILNKKICYSFNIFKIYIDTFDSFFLVHKMEVFSCEEQDKENFNLVIVLYIFKIGSVLDNGL